MQKNVQNTKVEMETIKKTYIEGKLEIKNLGDAVLVGCLPTNQTQS